MSTKPTDTVATPEPGTGQNDSDQPIDDVDGPATAQNAMPKSHAETVLPPASPGIVKVRPGKPGGNNPFLKHFVEDGSEPDPLLKPKMEKRSADSDAVDEIPTDRNSQTLNQSLDELDDDILATENGAAQKIEDSTAPEPQTQTTKSGDHDGDIAPTPVDAKSEPQSIEAPVEPEQAAEPDIVAGLVPEIAHDVAAALPFVSFKGVQKTFDGKTLVVKNLNLSVAKGEFLTLLGPSGSGKTTTLMMLAGFEQPTQGDILLEGEPVAHTPPHKRNIGMVFQNYALFPHMTVAENLAFPLKVRSMASAAVKDRVARALRMVSLEGFEKRRPFQLSGGQQQRVAVARALVFSPSLVLMDEPLGALDRHLREQMQFEIKKLHRDLGLTVVYVTHDQSEALTLSDRIAVFNDGHIQQIDTPETLYERPANAFVATFVGENNKLMGTVEAADEDYAVVKLDGGQIIKASRRDCGSSGARTVVTIRPEHLVVVPDQAVSGDRSAISAHVEDMVFHGDHMRLKLSVPGGSDIIVKTPTRITGLRGDTVFVAFKVNDAPAFRPIE